MKKGQFSFVKPQKRLKKWNVLLNIRFIANYLFLNT